MVKCSICSYQCDNWYVSNWRLACHINFCLGRCSLELAQRPSRVALAWHLARRSTPFGVTEAHSLNFQMDIKRADCKEWFTIAEQLEKLTSTGSCIVPESAAKEQCDRQLKGRWWVSAHLYESEWKTSVTLQKIHSLKMGAKTHQHWLQYKRPKKTVQMRGATNG